MRKLHLIGLGYDRDAVLDALERTNAVEVKLYPEQEGTAPLEENGEELRARLSAAESALSLLLSEGEKYASAHGKKDYAPPAGLTVSYGEFLAARGQRTEAEELIASIVSLAEEKTACDAEEGKLARALEAALPYAGLTRPFGDYADTRSVKMYLGSVPANSWSNCKAGLDGLPLSAYEAEEGTAQTLLALAVHKSAQGEADALLSGAGFVPCPYRGEQTGKALVAETEAALRETAARRERAQGELFALASRARFLEIYCDCLRFELEKEELSGKMRATERTFLLEAFVPAVREQDVKDALGASGFALYFEFSDPSPDEPVPTLLKNNKVVENFETITNMYSPPNARELDPNTVMSFFYSLFIGFIMADIGYGLMMLLGGGFLYYKNRARKGGVKSLAGVFAIGGIFAVVWGALFNSLFGIKVLPWTVMPDAQSKMWSLAGIDIPAVLLISLMIGIVQLMAGYLCKAAQHWRRGKFFDGLFDGVVWALFSVGAEFALIGLITVTDDSGAVVFHEPPLMAAGGCLAGAMLLVAVLTAGRHEKLLGKFTKGFGSLYGLINYFTDVLSYIRLYGLMLTGAVIAQVISQYALSFLTSGSALIVLGAVLMVVGHVFNLAISLLGAYIHTARLQYVEFFGRFYEGEGELFAPLGSGKKYIEVV